MKEFILTNKIVLIMFVAVNAGIVLFMSLITRFTHKKDRLKEKGYSEEYIRFYNKTSEKFGGRIFFILILAQIAAWIIVYFIEGEVTPRMYGNLVWPIAFFLTIPFAIIFWKQIYSEYKMLVKETESEIIIDFNFRILKLIFNKILEIPVSLLVIIYTLFNIEFGNSGIIYVYVMLLWFFYMVLRLGKNYNKPAFKDTYLNVAKFSIVYQGILIFIVIANSLKNADTYSGFNYTLFGVIVAILVSKAVYYTSNYSKLKKTLDKLTEEISNKSDTSDSMIMGEK